MGTFTPTEPQVREFIRELITNNSHMLWELDKDQGPLSKERIMGELYHRLEAAAPISFNSSLKELQKTAWHSSNSNGAEKGTFWDHLVAELHRMAKASMKGKYAAIPGYHVKKKIRRRSPSPSSHALWTDSDDATSDEPYFWRLAPHALGAGLQDRGSFPVAPAENMRDLQAAPQAARKSSDRSEHHKLLPSAMEPHDARGELSPLKEAARTADSLGGVAAGDSDTKWQNAQEEEMEVAKKQLAEGRRGAHDRLSQTPTAEERAEAHHLATLAYFQEKAVDEMLGEMNVSPGAKQLLQSGTVRHNVSAVHDPASSSDSSSETSEADINWANYGR